MTHIVLYRPAITDLILTKMMRGADEEDLADIRFLALQPTFSGEALRAVMDTAMLPDIEGVRELFEQARVRIGRELLGRR